MQVPLQQPVILDRVLLDFTSDKVLATSGHRGLGLTLMAVADKDRLMKSHNRPVMNTARAGQKVQANI